MGTFVTAVATPAVYTDKTAAPGLSLRSGWTAQNVAAAADLNTIKNALLDCRTALRGTVFNVRHYGAFGDGITDDTAAIQAALTAAAAVAGSVYVPASTAPYMITGLTISSGVTLYGDGMSTAGGVGSELAMVGDTAHAIYGADVRYVTIRDLNIVGARANSTLGSWDGIFLDLTASAALASNSLQNLYIKAFSRNAVNFENGITSTIFNVRAENCSGQGFLFTTGTSLTIASCYANGCGNGYKLDTIVYASLIACAADSCAKAYELTSSSNITIQGCGAEVCTGTGYTISGGTCNTLISCYQKDNPGIGYSVTGSSTHAILLNPRETSPGGGATASISVAAGCSAFVAHPQVATATSYAANTTVQLTDLTFSLASTAGASLVSGRASTASFAEVKLATNGTDRWSVQTRNDSSEDLHIRNSAQGFTVLLVENRATAPNISLLTSTKSYGGGVGVVFAPNASTVPSSNPTGGGILYVEAGALKYRGSSGTVTVLGAA